MTPNPGQTNAIKTILDAWKDGDQYVSMAGAGGTGKTTTAKEIAKAAKRNIVYAGMTGKAACNLSAKVGAPAHTLHRVTFSEFEHIGDKLKCGGNARLLQPGDGLIVDEASMLDVWLQGQLTKRLPVGCQVLLLGDPHQLGPVNGDLPTVLKNPTARLTQIMRHGGQLCDIVTEVRNGGKLPVDSGGIYSRSVGGVDDAAAWILERPKHATVICYTNEMRKAINAAVLAKTSQRRIVVTTNNRRAEVFNGQTFDVLGMGKYMLDARETTDVGKPPKGWRASERTMKFRRDLIGAKSGEFKAAFPNGGHQLYCNIDWGWALTAHKSQGSEWDHVCVVLCDAMVKYMSREELRRWIYTAATRAKVSLTVIDARVAR